MFVLKKNSFGGIKSTKDLISFSILKQKLTGIFETLTILGFLKAVDTIGN